MKTNTPGTSTQPHTRWWINHTHIRGHKYTLPIRAWATETWTGAHR